MLIRRRIRSLMYLGVTLLCVIVAALSFASIQGVLKFRKLTKNIRGRATELPLAADLSHEVNKLLALPEVKAAIQAQGAEVQTMSAEAFSSLLKTDHVKWKAIVQASGATIE